MPAQDSLDFEEYQELAQKTMAKMNSYELDMSHMTIGMFSEYYELYEAMYKQDIVNIAEEIADIQWYFAGYCTIRGKEMSSFVVDRPWSFEDKRLSTSISELADLVKKNIIYRKDINEQFENKILMQIQYNLDRYINQFSLKTGNILYNNIEKLKVRFPNKFSEEKALNRNLKEERNKLES